jgi:hypothetical protein
LKIKSILITVSGTFLTLCTFTKSMEEYAHIENRPLVNLTTRTQRALSLSMIPAPERPEIFSDRVVNPATDLQIALQLSRDSARDDEVERQLEGDIERALEESRKLQAQQDAVRLVDKHRIAQGAEAQFQRARTQRHQEKSGVVATINAEHPTLISLWETYMKAKQTSFEKLKEYSEKLTEESNNEMSLAARIVYGIFGDIESATLREKELITKYFELSTADKNPKGKLTDKYTKVKALLDQMKEAPNAKEELCKSRLQADDASGKWACKMRTNGVDGAEEEYRALTKSQADSSAKEAEYEAAVRAENNLIQDYFTLISKK